MPQLKCAPALQITDDCMRNLTSAGFVISSCNTRANAQDLEDLRSLLKLPKLNIFGSSYGSRLALRYSTDFPRRLRLILLTGAISGKFEDFVSNSPRAFDDVMERVWDDCQQNKSCSTNFPHLRATYDAILNNPLASKGVALPVDEICIPFLILPKNSCCYHY